MNKYDSETTARFDQQFTESEAERNERRRSRRLKEFARKDDADDDAVSAQSDYSQPLTKFQEDQATIATLRAENEALRKDAMSGRVKCQATGTYECHFRKAQRILGDPRVPVGGCAALETMAPDRTVSEEGKK